MDIYDAEKIIPGEFIDAVVFCVEPISSQCFVFLHNKAYFKKIMTGFS